MLKELLEAATEEIENVYGHDTVLTERIREYTLIQKTEISVINHIPGAGKLV